MVKTYSTYDFQSVDKRVEKTKIDPYKVQLEDYENINDLVLRSVKTKTPLKNNLPDKLLGAEYDADEIIDEWLNDAGIIQQKDDRKGEVSDQAKQSDGQTDNEPLKEVSAG